MYIRMESFGLQSTPRQKKFPSFRIQASRRVLPWNVEGTHDFIQSTVKDWIALGIVFVDLFFFVGQDSMPKRRKALAYKHLGQGHWPNMPNIFWIYLKEWDLSPEPAVADITSGFLISARGEAFPSRDLSHTWVHRQTKKKLPFVPKKRGVEGQFWAVGQRCTASVAHARSSNERDWTGNANGWRCLCAWIQL